MMADDSVILDGTPSPEVIRALRDVLALAEAGDVSDVAIAATSGGKPVAVVSGHGSALIEALDMAMAKVVEGKGSETLPPSC